jgi:threonine dehydratase
MSLPTRQDILDARSRIQDIVHKTPVLTSSTLNAICQAEVFLKCEQFQRMGAYKMRGASHALSRLSEQQLRKGVVTHSSGNFAQALALASKIKGIKAVIVMPENAPKVKVNAVKGYGAEIVTSGNTPSDRAQKVKEIMEETGMTFIHPSNDLQVILGNSTSAQELIEAFWPVRL